MTAKTFEGALALEAQRRDDRDARIRAEGFRAGAEAMREHIAQAFEKSAGRLWRVQATVIRSIDIPEMPNG